MEYNAPGSRDIVAVRSDGVLASFAPGVGNTLTAATFYFTAGGMNAPMPSQTSVMSFHLKWAAAVAGTITVEVCNFPAYANGNHQGPVDVSDFDATAGNWIPWNPATVIPDIVQTVGTGNTATAYTITAGGTNAGGAVINFSALGFRRVRLHAVLTVGGVVRCAVTGKQGA